MNQPKIGASHTVTLTVSEQHLACAVGSGTVAVFATPALAALLEGAACTLAASFLSEEDTTVGTQLELSHLAPTVAGVTVTAQATLIQVDGRSFTFTLTASDNAGTIATGTHTRVCVNAARFAQKAQQRGGQQS